MNATTIKLHHETKHMLDTFREYKNESYDEVIRKIVNLIEEYKKSPQLAKETIAAIERARKRIKKGNFMTEEEAMRRLGL